MFDPRSLTKPIVAAPMAGGPSTPALAAAVATAGGLGFLAGGYRTPEQLADQLAAARALTTGPIGINIFVPQPSAANADAIARYAAELAPDAARLGTEVGIPQPSDDGWAAKLELLLELRPEVASFTFGSPDAQTLDRLSAARVFTIVTVTTADEARSAIARGAHGLTLQGPDAGGHRATFDPTAPPAGGSLADTTRQLLALTEVPVFVGGGIRSAADAVAALDWGASGVQVGTALLRAHEAGTNPVHRAALADPRFTETAHTLAFSGRYARGLRNGFMRRHDATAPFGYPEVNQLTGPLRSAAVAAGDPDGASLWAGTGWRTSIDALAADIIDSLTP